MASPHNQHLHQHHSGVAHPINIHSNAHIKKKVEEKKKKKTLMDHINNATNQAKHHWGRLQTQVRDQTERTKVAFNKRKADTAATIQGHTEAIKKRGATLRAKVGIGGRRRRRHTRRRRRRRRPRRRRHRRTRRRHRRTIHRHRRARRRLQRTRRRRRR